MATAEEVLQPRLSSSRLILEPFQDRDVNDVFAYASHPDIATYVPWSPHQTVENSRGFLEYMKEKTSSQRGNLFFVFALRLRESNRVIGSLDFKTPFPHVGQFDYALGVDYWNQGIMSEAVQTVMSWAIQTFPEIIRYQAYCAVENVGSSRVMEKVGMTYEGTRRKLFLFKGRYIDIADYALILNR